MKKFDINSTKAMFLLWLTVTLISNIVLGKFGSNLAVVLICLVLYAAAWFFFMRADIIEYMTKSKTPVISLGVTMLILWVIVAFISASPASGQAWLMIRGVFLLLLIYSSAPVAYTALYFGNSLEGVAQSIIPAMFAILIVFRLLFYFTYDGVQKKKQAGKLRKK